MNNHDAPRRKMPAYDTFLEDETIASATECTGLMPSAPQSPSESSDLASLMAIHTPPVSTEKGQVSAPPDDENGRPCDEHNPRKKIPSSRLASIPALYRPGASQDPPKTDRGGASPS